jgi:hypothetical protein
MPISAELAAVYASAPYDSYYVETLQLEHPIFAIEPTPGSIFITNQKDGFDNTLPDGRTVTYIPTPFVAIPPNSDENSALQLQVAIDNASRGIMDNLERLGSYPTDPITVTYRVYLSYDLGPAGVIQNDPPLVLQVTNVTATDLSVTFTASLTNLRQRAFPSKLYTTKTYPGLAR